MAMAMYNTGLVQTAKNPVLMSTKYTVNLATGVCTNNAGKRVGCAAGVGTGVLTFTLPQIFNALEYADVITLDPTLTGTYAIPTQDLVTVNGKSTIQFTMVKGGTPAAVTTGSFILYATFIGTTS